MLLNRAPTLHRLSIQAFEPVLIEGSAIKVHPLVCTAYNADFDGDQMAVHVPLSIEAQMEARQLMLATKNIFSPASGRPITTPSQDIILGTYYLTYARPRTELDRENDRAANKHFPLFGSTSEVEYAIASRKISYRQIIRFSNPDFGKETVYGDSESKVIETTPARVRFNEIFPENLGFINFNVSKKHVGDIIWQCYQVAGHEATVKALDLLKDLGFKEATRSGTSIGLVDMVIPEDKGAKLKAAYTDIDKVTKEYRNGVITNGERYQRVVDVWTQTTEAIADSVYRKLEFNDGDTDVSPLFMMVDSAARGNRAQIKQLSGMRGLMAKPSGDIIERPITSNFREGLSVLEYFISTHGARKGLADTALKTADSGYMTRKLVDVAQDVIISELNDTSININSFLTYGVVNINHKWKKVNLSKSFTNPIVIPSDPTFKGKQSAAIRLKNITSNSFLIKLQEPNYLDGSHVNETICYVVGEKGTWDINGTLFEFNTFNTNKLSSKGFKRINFNNSYSSKPSVFSQIQTFNGSDWVISRTKNINSSYFLFSMQEEEKINNGGHVNEKIGWFSISNSQFTNNGLKIISKTINNVNHKYKTINYSSSFSSTPFLITKLSSFNGADTANLRIIKNNKTRFVVKLQEEQSKDKELNHINENICYFAIK